MGGISEKRIFVSESELSAILEGINRKDAALTTFYEALQVRVSKRLNRNLSQLGETTDWYYPAMEYLSDAAMSYLIHPDVKVGNWLRNVLLEMVNRPTYEWVGPEFRDHSEPFTGHLETAHLCWATAIVLDLTPHLFEKSELELIRKSLLDKGIYLCMRWLSKNKHLANWRGIMTSGVVVGAAAIGATDLLDQFVPELSLCGQAFQPDGSYAESLQYGNYLAFALMLAYEALHRKYPEYAKKFDIACYAKGIRWITTSMFYSKPLAGWLTDEPVARAANFNDCAAIFRPSGDLLLQIACRYQPSEEAGLAGWLFEQYYAAVPEQEPHELASFGMRNDWGFLTLPFLTKKPPKASPMEAQLPEVTGFSNGHCFIRDAWNGNTIVAINGGGDPLNGPGHLHGDLNSFILAYKGERLLADPGHSCYRNLIHGLESSSQTHNTCTFRMEEDGLGLQEDKTKTALLEQVSILPRRTIIDGICGDPIDRKNRRSIIYRDNEISIIGSECGAAYGYPIQLYERYWILVGAQLLFIVDHIVAAVPVRTHWNWVVNNRDGKVLTRVENNNLLVTRNQSGMKMFHLGAGKIAHPVYSFLHDAYHVRPGQTGEGRSGSGLIYRYCEVDSAKVRQVIHAIVLDDPVHLDEWAVYPMNQGYVVQKRDMAWSIQVDSSKKIALTSPSGTIRSIEKDKVQISSLN